MTATVDVKVGAVVKAHGVRGGVVVESYTDEPSRFAPGAALTAAGGRRLTVTSSRPQGTRLIVTFDGVASREEADSLVNETLLATVPDDERPAGAEEYFDRQLVGLRVRLPDGSPAGEVTDVVHGPTQDVLVIATPHGERLVPFVEALVPSVDLDAGRLTVADIPGLLQEE